MKTKLLLALTITAGLWACSQEMGDMLIDAGESMNGSAQAQGGEVAECIPYTSTQTSDILESRITGYYASVPLRAGTTRVHATLCDHEEFSPTPTACPEGFTCTGSTGPVFRDAACHHVSAATIVDGRVIVGCGQRQSSEYFDEPDRNYDYGGYWRSVTIYQD